MVNDIKSTFEHISQNFTKLQDKASVIEEISQLWIDALKQGKKVIFCGNGGSAADSQHLSAELM